jgi:hypothetical protein
MKMGIDKVKVTKGDFIRAIIDKPLIHLVNLDKIINVKKFSTHDVSGVCLSYHTRKREKCRFDISGGALRVITIPKI